MSEIAKDASVGVGATLTAYWLFRSAKRAANKRFSRSANLTKSALANTVSKVTTAVVRKPKAAMASLLSKLKIMPHEGAVAKTKLLRICDLVSTPFANELKSVMRTMPDQDFSKALRQLYDVIYLHKGDGGKLYELLAKSDLYDAEHVLAEDEIFRISNTYKGAKVERQILKEFIMCEDKAARNLCILRDGTVSGRMSGFKHSVRFPPTTSKTAEYFRKYSISFEATEVSIEQVQLAKSLRSHIVDVGMIDTEVATETFVMRFLRRLTPSAPQEAVAAESALSSELAVITAREEAAVTSSVTTGIETGTAAQFVTALRGRGTLVAIGVGVIGGVGYYWWNKRSQMYLLSLYRNHAAIAEYNMFYHFTAAIAEAHYDSNMPDDMRTAIYSSISSQLAGYHILRDDYTWHEIAPMDVPTDLCYKFHTLIAEFCDEFKSLSSTFRAIDVCGLKSLLVRTCTFPISVPKTLQKSAPNTYMVVCAFAREYPASFLLDVGLGYCPPTIVLANHHHGYKQFCRFGHEFIDEDIISNHYIKPDPHVLDAVRFFATPEIIASDAGVIRKGETSEIPDIKLPEWHSTGGEFLIARTHREAGGDAMCDPYLPTYKCDLFSDFLIATSQMYSKLRLDNKQLLAKMLTEVKTYCDQRVV